VLVILLVRCQLNRRRLPNLRSLARFPLLDHSHQIHHVRQRIAHAGAHRSRLSRGHIIHKDASGFLHRGFRPTKRRPASCPHRSGGKWLWRLLHRSALRNDGTIGTLSVSPDRRTAFTSSSSHRLKPGEGRGHLDGPASASGQLLGDNHLHLDPRRFGCADPAGTSRLAHSLTLSKGHSHLRQTARRHRRPTEPNTTCPGLNCHARMFSRQ
jgi:hypothetical protein